MGLVRSLKSSPTTVYISHVRCKATAQGSLGGMITAGKPNVSVVTRDRSDLIPVPNSCTGPEQARLRLSLNYAAAAAHPAESVRSSGEVPHAVQQRRLCRFLPVAVLAVAYLSPFPPTLLLLQWKRPGLPSCFHQLNPGFPVRAELPHWRCSLALL